MAAEREFRVLSIAPLTPSAKEFTLEPVGEGAFTFRPGQFLRLHFQHQGEELQRSYSFASAPGDSRQFSIAVAPVAGGPGTCYLWGLEPGAIVRASGAYGRFMLRETDDAKRIVLIGTGTGVGPYRAMLPALEESGARSHIILGVRTRADALYASEFRAFAANSHHEFTTFLSRQSASAPDERAGYATRAIEDLGVRPGRDLVFLCGNPNMVDDGIAALRGRGFSPRHFRREKYL